MGGSDNGDLFFFSSRRRHTRWNCDWSSDVCSSDLQRYALPLGVVERNCNILNHAHFITTLIPSGNPARMLFPISGVACILFPPSLLKRRVMPLDRKSVV